MIPDPHEDDRPEVMLGMVIISAVLITAIAIISYFLVEGLKG
jgi:hypothetical protein